MNEAFDEEVMALFKEASIDFMKGGPSVTKEHQEWDAGRGLFPPLKSAMCVPARKRVKMFLTLCSNRTFIIG